MQIYVGNLPNGYRLSDLVQIFETYGCVSRASAVRDFAFLSIYDNEAARAAINSLNGSLFGEQEIVVEQARFYPRGRFQNSRGGGFARGGAVSQQGAQNSQYPNGEDGFHQQPNNVVASGSYYVNNEAGYQGNSIERNHGEGYVDGGNTENYSHDDPNQRGGRGGRRGGGFRRGRGARRGGGSRIYRGSNNAYNGNQQHDGQLQGAAEERDHHSASAGNAPVRAVAANLNNSATSALDNTNNSNQIAEHNVGNGGNERGGRGLRHVRRGGRGPRGGRGVPRRDPNNSQLQHANVPQEQVAGVPHIQSVGSGDGNLRKTELAGNGLPVQHPVSGNGVVPDKGQLNSGSGDMRAPQNASVVN